MKNTTCIAQKVYNNTQYKKLILQMTQIKHITKHNDTIQYPSTNIRTSKHAESITPAAHIYHKCYSRKWFVTLRFMKLTAMATDMNLTSDYERQKISKKLIVVTANMKLDH